MVIRNTEEGEAIAFEMDRYSHKGNSVHATAKRFLRRYVNPAIYIEKEIVEKPPRRIISRIGESSDEELEINLSRMCSNTTVIVSKSNESPASSAYFSNENSSSSSDNPKSATSAHELELQPNIIVMSELKLELKSLMNDKTENNESVKNWMEKKKNKLKQKSNKNTQIIMSKQAEEKRQKIVEQERENFKNWLAKKNKEQEMKRLEKISEVEVGKLEAVRKEKKKLESVNNFNEWLKKKKVEEIEKKLAQNLTVLTSYQAKLKRMEESELAYKEWLEHAKLRPKPIPMNQGLKSFSLLQSVTYINPIPWKANMEFDNKRLPC